MTFASRRKALATFKHRDKGVHLVVVMSPPSRTTALCWGRKIALGGVERLLATTSPDAHRKPKLRLADLDTLTRVVYAVLLTDVAEGSGLCAGAPFTKAKAAADFPEVDDLLPADADDDSDEFVAVQVPVALLLRGENPALHGKKADEVRSKFKDHDNAATAWYDAHRAHISAASATLFAQNVK